MTQTKFEGHEPRECGEHHTTGLRAWCFSCSEWCYPQSPCKGCELPMLRAASAEFGPMYQEGQLSIEFAPDFTIKSCNVGVQVAADGRVWVCIDGRSFLRFKPTNPPTQEQP